MTTINNIETEYREFNNKNEWPVIFQRIRSDCAQQFISSIESNKPQNKALNRYRDVSPYDHSRIVLQRGTTDYINANLVRIERAGRRYILTQGPMPNTVGHFWLMVWEQCSAAVLMLNRLVEKQQEKCSQYWPAKIGADHAMRLKDVDLSVEYVEEKDYSHYRTRTLKLTDGESGESRTVTQFHYTTWPDFGVPTSPTAFLEFLRKVRKSGALEADVGPAIVHCSAGIGRSGTFCLVDSCLVLIEKYGLNSVNVREVLMEMRGYRVGLIQTHEQLRFSYEAIIEGAKVLTNPSSSPVPNHVEVENSVNDAIASSSDSEDDPPPLPPPRSDSLKQQNGVPIDKPLPNIPNSVSLNDIAYEDDNNVESHIPTKPIDEVEEEHSSNDELEDESKTDDTSAIHNDVSSSELRHRKRVEHKKKLEEQVREMKRRQQVNEQWTQLKRSLYKFLIITGPIAIGGGLFAYFYLKN